MNWLKKYLVLILVVLFSFSTLGARYLVGGQTFGERYPGVSPEGLVVWLDQSDIRSYGDTQTWNDISGLRNNVDQITGVNQPTPAATYRTFATNDFLQQTEVDDETGVTFWPTYPGLTTTATAAKIRLQGLDLTQYAVASGNSTHRLVLKDSAAAVIAWGYIRGADSALALGSELHDNSNAASISSEANATTGWGAIFNTAVTSSTTQKHSGTYSIRAENGAPDGRTGVQLTKTFTDGILYYFDFWLYVETTSEVFSFDLIGGTNVTLVFDTSSTVPANTWTNFTGYFVGRANTTLRIRHLIDEASVWYLDDVSIKPVTAFGTDGVLINSTAAGGTQSWTGTGAGDPNDPSTLEVYKTLGDLTGDMTVLMWVKPDDGQPGLAETLIGNDDTAGTRAWYLRIPPTGTLEINRRNVAVDLETAVTTSAFFSNGAQANFALVGFTFDLSTGVLTPYGNGLPLAVAEIWTATATQDTYWPLMIGVLTSTGFFNGKIGAVMVFERALSAAEIQQIYLTDYSRFAIAWWRQLILPFVLVITIFTMITFLATRKRHDAL